MGEMGLGELGINPIGMVVGFIVQSVIPSGGGAQAPPLPASNKEGIKEWIKRQLSNLGKLSANLAGKAAAVLPGAIGTIISWLLSTTGKVVYWYGNNVWALIVSVVGLLYVAAQEYFKMVNALCSC